MSLDGKELSTQKLTQKKKNRKQKKRSKQPSNNQNLEAPHQSQSSKLDLASSQKDGHKLKPETQKPGNQSGRDGKKKRKLSQEIKEDEATAAVATSAHAATAAEGERPRYMFQVDDTDHCETPFQAYRDILDVLDRLANSLHKKRSSLTIYDPYYCDGGVKKKLASFGFTSVINRNRDFYDDIEKGETPEYDVLVTNPPYSGVHMEKILAFCSSQSARKQKPFLLLLPHFVYTKDYYERALSSSKVFSSMFFLVPQVRYSYIPPSWVSAAKGSKALEQGKNKTAPFPSFWYAQVPERLIPNHWLVQQFGPSGMVCPKHHSKLRYAKSSKDIPRDFRGEFDPNNKRANPRARKRAAKKRREEQAAMMGGGGMAGGGR